MSRWLANAARASFDEGRTRGTLANDEPLHKQLLEDSSPPSTPSAPDPDREREDADRAR